MQACCAANHVGARAFDFFHEHGEDASSDRLEQWVVAKSECALRAGGAEQAVLHESAGERTFVALCLTERSAYSC